MVLKLPYLPFKEEIEISEKLYPEIKSFFPKDLKEYTNVIKNARAALVSRIHAGIALAGIGVPSVVTGTDTRIYTIKQFELPTFSSLEVDSSELIDALKKIIKNGEEEHSKLIDIREMTINSYCQKIKENIK